MSLKRRSTQENLADINTKFVLHKLFYNFRDKLHLVNLNKRTSKRMNSSNSGEVLDVPIYYVLSKG